MENLVFTQLSIPEIRKIIREECQRAMDAKQSIAPETDDFLSIEKVSEFLQIPIATLYDYTHKKKIPFSKVGRKLLFSKKELLEWMKSNRKRTKQEMEIEAEIFVHKKIMGGK